jgi:Caspase domain
MKRALLVGIDQYPDPRNNLNSCVADTLAFKNMLISAYGFDSGDVRLLHNNAATITNVRAGLDDLMRGVAAGDQVVYFESSHGYRYPQGDTMVEVLCLYDEFLTDQEFARRTGALPPDVLTVVLDACHSGGMDKVFFPPDGPTVARAKVWQPPVQDAINKAQQVHQVSRFKSFGRSIASHPADVVKAFSVGPSIIAKLSAGHGAAPQSMGLKTSPAFRVRIEEKWSAKDFTSGSSELNGALFAACQADQTAAAGSPVTNNLSAFTYSLIDQLDTGISLRDLCARTVARLQALNMSQTPVVDVPPDQPGLGDKTFITVRAISAVSVPSAPPAQPTSGEAESLADIMNRIFGKQPAGV